MPFAHAPREPANDNPGIGVESEIGKVEKPSPHLETGTALKTGVENRDGDGFSPSERKTGTRTVLSFVGLSRSGPTRLSKAGGEAQRFGGGSLPVRRSVWAGSADARSNCGFLGGGLGLIHAFQPVRRHGHRPGHQDCLLLAGTRGSPVQPGPRPVLRPPDDPRPHRVPLHVPQDRQRRASS